jgi:hypothetical protein
MNRIEKLNLIKTAAPNDWVKNVLLNPLYSKNIIKETMDILNRYRIGKNAAENVIEFQYDEFEYITSGDELFEGATVQRNEYRNIRMMIDGKCAGKLDDIILETVISWDHPKMENNNTDYEDAILARQEIMEY